MVRRHLAIIIAAFLAGLPAGESTTAAEPRVEIGGPFELVDQYGAVRTDTDFRGRYMLMFFGYTWCPDICPVSLHNMTLAMEALGDEARRVQPIFVTVDPERDTVEHLRDYASYFHPSLIALTGAPAQVATMADAYGVIYERVGGDGDDYLLNHSAFIYLMDEEGQFVRFFSHETMAEELATGLAEVWREREG